MLGVTLIVRIAVLVGVREQPDCADLISNGNDWAADDFGDFDNLVVLVVECVNSFQRVRTLETLLEPFKFKVDCVSVNDSLCFDFKQDQFTEVVLTLKVIVVDREVDVLDTCSETKESFEEVKPVLDTVQ